jgi:hypothetical protein
MIVLLTLCDVGVIPCDYSDLAIVQLRRYI